MKDLVIYNTQNNVSKVLIGTISFKGPNNEFIGIIEYRARMRYPIAHIIKLLREKNQI